jgi:hypothetical protein
VVFLFLGGVGNIGPICSLVSVGHIYYTKHREQTNKEKPKQSRMVKNTEMENNHPQTRVGKQAA